MNKCYNFRLMFTHNFFCVHFDHIIFHLKFVIKMLHFFNNFFNIPKILWPRNTCWKLFSHWSSNTTHIDVNVTLISTQMHPHLICFNFFLWCPISFKLLLLLLGISQMPKELHCAYFPFIVIVFFFHIFLHKFSFTHLLEVSLSSFFNKPPHSSNCAPPILNFSP